LPFDTNRQSATSSSIEVFHFGLGPPALDPGSLRSSFNTLPPAPPPLFVAVTSPPRQCSLNPCNQFFFFSISFLPGSSSTQRGYRLSKCPAAAPAIFLHGLIPFQLSFRSFVPFFLAVSKHFGFPHILCQVNVSLFSFNPPRLCVVARLDPP